MSTKRLPQVDKYQIRVIKLQISGVKPEKVVLLEILEMLQVSTIIRKREKNV